MEQTKVENSIHVIEVSLSNKKEYNMEDLVFQGNIIFFFFKKKKKKKKKKKHILN